jgi:hypothetical protein
MRRFWKIAGVALLVAILGVGTTVGIVLAQGSKDGTTSAWDFRAKLREAIAEALGITVEKYDTTIQEAQQKVLDEAVKEGLLTQEQADRMAERMGDGWGDGMMGPGGPGRGFMGPHMGRMGGAETSLVAVAVDKLGMTQQDLMTELRNGKTIADVAKEKNVDVQTILDAYATQLKAKLDQAVADGKITQAAADQTLEQAKTRAAEQVNSTWKSMGPSGDWKGGRPGRMWNNQDQNGL